uniref:Calpain catalytic domain-containing protein n=1 Tax=Setaria digitata TaxID=48799 RepID=A0A915Q477_9BILA
MKIPSNMLACFTNSERDRSGEHQMKCYKLQGNQIGDIIGGFISGGSGPGGRGSHHGDGGGVNVGDIAGIIGGLAGPGSKGEKLGGLISGIGGLIGKKGGHYKGGGPNVDPNNLNGGMVDVVSGLVGHLAHRYLNVDPTTGRIIGAIAGNLVFNLGGKDNKLGAVGKIVLDNIISGKFKRKVDPYIPPKPSIRRIPPTPGRRADVMLDFYTERDRCLAERQLFEDPQFPADDSSLFFSRSPPKQVEWRRPGEICDTPQLIYEGQSRFDVVQGELGDCWLLAAAANLTLRDELFYRVVPPDQSFTENYAGIFHFQFWHYGTWVDVVIDDRLPTSASGELLYMHSRDNNEFWSALLEKAYAKLHGSYEALKGGTTSEALEDFTGGLTEFFDLQQPPNHLMEMMMRGFEMGSLFGCSIEADPHQWEARLRNGLVKGHAYSITGMKMVNGPRGRIPILRIRNPWGNEQEWNGAWSDNSSEWEYISKQQREEMGLVFAHDGEFWMAFNDFLRYFEKMEICNLGPEVMNEVYQMTGVQGSQNGWATYTHNGAWIANETAGGCRNYIQTFPMNPQYHIQVTDSDPYDDDNLCTVIIAVLQKYRRELKHMGVENLPIGFAVYDTGNLNGRLTRGYFQQHKSCARSAAFINLREVTGRFRIPPGNYVIVPSTFEPNEEAEFMLRVYTNDDVASGLGSVMSPNRHIALLSIFRRAVHLLGVTLAVYLRLMKLTSTCKYVRRAIQRGKSEGCSSEPRSTRIIMDFLIRLGKSIGIISVPVVFVDVIGYPASITGSSMEPTLHGSSEKWWERDIVWLSRFGLHTPKIGQIYTFIPPNDPDKRHIKRVTAVDGDIIKPKRGPSYIEVPTGCYWMESDNPNNYYDSRLYGPASFIRFS